jgi:hypothetical protein
MPSMAAPALKLESPRIECEEQFAQQRGGEQRGEQSCEDTNGGQPSGFFQNEPLDGLAFRADSDARSDFRGSAGRQSPCRCSFPDDPKRQAAVHGLCQGAHRALGPLCAGPREAPNRKCPICFQACKPAETNPARS